MSDTQIVCLNETKIKQIPPELPGFTWIQNRYRKSETRGGGVAILARNDIKHLIKPVDNLEDYDQEITWIELINVTKTYIGVFYGPQEKCTNEEAQRQYSQLTTQINKLKLSGEIILTGDFNAKLEINTTNIRQERSKNGKYMQEMITSTGMQTISIDNDSANWTRVKRKDTTEKSIIDYVLMKIQ